jgi:TolA-binding protein
VATSRLSLEITSFQELKDLDMTANSTKLTKIVTNLKSGLGQSHSWLVREQKKVIRAKKSLDNELKKLNHTLEAKTRELEEAQTQMKQVQEEEEREVQNYFPRHYIFPDDLICFLTPLLYFLTPLLYFLTPLLYFLAPLFFFLAPLQEREERKEEREQEPMDQNETRNDNDPHPGNPVVPPPLTLGERNKIKSNLRKATMLHQAAFASVASKTKLRTIYDEYVAAADRLRSSGGYIKGE